MFRASVYGRHGNPKNGFSDWMDGKVEEFLAANKQEIIDMAAHMLADRLSRTKAARELLKENA